MADISSVALPSGTSYTVKDSSARTSLNNTTTRANLLVMQSSEIDNQTINATTNATFDITITKSGYTPLGIVGWGIYSASSNGANNGWCTPYGVGMPNTATARFVIRNYASSAAKVKLRVYVLYRKS